MAFQHDMTGNPLAIIFKSGNRGISKPGYRLKLRQRFLPYGGQGRDDSGMGINSNGLSLVLGKDSRLCPTDPR